jgi:serine/threonine protein kinase
MTNLLCFLARVILYVLLAGFLPFDEPTIMQLFTKIQKAEFTYPSWFTPEIRGVLDQMLVADPKVRIGLAQLREHLVPTWRSRHSTSSIWVGVWSVYFLV